MTTSLELLSVIIPTHKRPQFLPRAIESALQASPNGDVEVIVVPNGPDTSWQSVAEQFKDEPRVKWHPIEKAHANAARNHGMKLAQGEYIRFLDDDDFFYPEAAQKQLAFHIEKEVDVTYGYINSTFQNIVTKVHSGSRLHEFCSFVFYPYSPTPLHGFLYRTAIVKSLNWDERVNKRQDLYWLFELCRHVETKFSVFPHSVGAWVQHEGERVSKGHSVNQTSKETAKRTLDVYFHLKDQNRLNEERKMAISSRLWRCVHDGLMFEPLYWIKIAFIARRISQHGNPATPIYQKLPNWLNPLIWELLIVPVRWVKVLTGHHYSN